MAATSVFGLGEWSCLGDPLRAPLGKNWSERALTLRKISSLNCSRRTAAGLRRILTTCRVYVHHSKLISPSLAGCVIFMRCSAEKTLPMPERAYFGETQVCFFCYPGFGGGRTAIHTFLEISRYGRKSSDKGRIPKLFATGAAGPHIGTTQINCCKPCPRFLACPPTQVLCKST